MFGICPLCNKPILLGASLRIVREQPELEDKSPTRLEHFDCDDPSRRVVHANGKQHLPLSKGGKH